MSRASVFLGVPHYGQLHPAALPGLLNPSLTEVVLTTTNGASLLAHNFNRLFTDCLNRRKELELTHFAMAHADIGSPSGWIDVLLAEMERVGADIISVVVPIKDLRGVTSTGWQDPKTTAITRFTMTEIMGLPETFDAEAAGKAGQHLMVNTGLWLAKLGPWADEFPGFEIRDRIVKHGDIYRANVLPEDWNFSGWAARRGLRVFATRKVTVAHHGTAGYANDRAWGEWKYDKGDGNGEN